MITAFIIGFVALIISAILEKDKEFSWRKLLRDLFFVFGVCFISLASHKFIKNHVTEEIEADITINTENPDLIIKGLQEDFNVSQIDTIDETTYRLRICNKQNKE